jgi:DNA-binding response OmpR family regulator
MGKRKPGHDQGSGGSAKGPVPGSIARASTPRVLAVEPEAAIRKQISAALSGLNVICDVAATIAEGRKAMESGEYDVVLIDEKQRDGCGLEVLREIVKLDQSTRVIVTSSRAELGGAVEAMRCGAIDFIAMPVKGAEIARRVESALSAVRRLRDERRRVERLKRLCKRLNIERQEVSKQVDSLCEDLVTAYQELADQMGQVSLASEFASMVRQELDVENLLRSTLEYMLTRSGPTNAAVFLPTGQQDFNLGAYVNYDLPKETADVLLDHLADSLAPRLQQDTEIRRYDTREQLEARLGDVAGWLGDSSVVTFTCRDNGDCLAVVALFRDRRTGFSDELLQQLAVLRDIFGEQLARVVRIHHRHMPKDAWPGFDVEDDRGLAA